ncbi:hypothetical protein [Adonisia turfae]|uniref:Uncharacterized protein n=1 Tax=Adonisia turfae CCMR0081 TaxID=2292702 RepID=A0A6M0RCY6_9CYAN|nr:hypothetical protein [Adonisia turfae]NEZ54218.1 hypothetical protein [Adonisia turfae CCMR0081]
MIAFLASPAMVNEVDGQRYPQATFVIAAALAGSLVNQPFRNAQETSEEDVFSLMSYIIWKSLVAIIFAILLTLIFTAEILTGDLFPKFRAAGEDYENAIAYVKSVNPDTNKDLAKLLVWSFVAGFSEKFVPNIISRTLTVRAKDDDVAPIDDQTSSTE